MKTTLINQLFLSTIILFAFSCGKNDQTNSSSKEMIQSSIIVGELDWKEVTSLDINDPKRINSFSIGDISIPKAFSRCTGFLITEDIVMTNQHCIVDESYAKGVTVSFKHEAGVKKSNWATYDCSTFIGNDETLDYALLKCNGKPGKVHGVVTLSKKNFSAGDPIYIVQQNCDYYKKRNCDWTKKYSVGKITGISDEYTHSADTLGGSSGSPMFSKDTHRVVGLHHAGYGNDGSGRGVINYSVPMSDIVYSIEEYYPEVFESSAVVKKDITEPNNSLDNAFVLTSQNVDTLEETKIGSSSDVDYFQFSTTRYDEINVTLLLNHEVGDLDMYLLDSKGERIDKSESTTNEESISKYLPKGTYFLVVKGYRKATGKYKLTLN